MSYFVSFECFFRTSGHNLCSQLKPCTHLCLAEAENRYQCACPDDMKTARHANGSVTCLYEDDESREGKYHYFDNIPSFY